MPKMSRNKTKNSAHAYERAAERLGWSKRKAKEEMAFARQGGLSVGELKPGALRDWLYAKQRGTPRKLKIWKGCVFVFCSTSTRCLTVYPLPEAFSHPKACANGSAGSASPEPIETSSESPNEALASKCESMAEFLGAPDIEEAMAIARSAQIAEG